MSSSGSVADDVWKQYTEGQKPPSRTMPLKDCSRRTSMISGFQRNEGEVTFDSSASDADLQRLKETVDRHRPVLDILSNPVPVAPAAARAAGVESAAA